MDPKSSGMNESFIVPLLMAASTPKTSPPSLGDDSNTTLTFDLPPKSSPSPLQSSPPSPSPSPPPKDSPSPKALPSPSPKTLPSPSPPPSSPPYSPPPPPKDSSSQPSSNKSPPPPYKPTAPPPSNGSSSSGAGTSKKLPPSRLPWYSSLAPNNTSAPNRFSSPPPTVFSPPPISKSNRPPPPHSSAVSAGSHGKSNNSTYSSLNSSSGGGDDNSANYVGAVVAGVFIIIALVVAVVLLLIRRRRKRVQVYAAPHFMPPNSPPMTPDWHYYVQRQHGTGNASKDGIYRNGSQNLLGNPDTGPISAQIVFSYEKIMEITNGFSRQNIIGEGGFGYVYKAQLPDGRMAAVKKLKAGSGQGEREFKTEVEIISRLHHRHLVSLVGYCIEEGQRILIYEFVPNKTLDHHLHGRDMPVLDWAKRRKMAIGAAKVLAYLHEDSKKLFIGISSLQTSSWMMLLKPRLRTLDWPSSEFQNF
ncbi:hypothetical protein L6164_020630 [Bauhinia variegata]|uniref:Uncharacterized protein n=1 Tax=Bauhinia variegata TaxID=167791 RepID=A0ACB9MWH4_BAUVA|nr:hypothetical protein L6164_020630 [Bauhinia variegata]